MVAAIGQLIGYAALIISTMAMLDWFESRRCRSALALRRQREGLNARGASRTAAPTSYSGIKTLLVAAIGLAVTTFATPAAAYVVEVATSIPLAAIQDESQLKHAVVTPSRGPVALE